MVRSATVLRGGSPAARMETSRSIGALVGTSSCCAIAASHASRHEPATMAHRPLKGLISMGHLNRSTRWELGERLFEGLLREPLQRPLARLLRLDISIPWRRVRLHGGDQAIGGGRHLVDGEVERGFVRFRGTRRTAQHANELKCRRANLILGGGRL